MFRFLHLSLLGDAGPKEALVVPIGLSQRRGVTERDWTNRFPWIFVPWCLREIHAAYWPLTESQSHGEGMVGSIPSGSQCLGASVRFIPPIGLLQRRGVTEKDWTDRFLLDLCALVPP